MSNSEIIWILQRAIERAHMFGFRECGICRIVKDLYETCMISREQRSFMLSFIDTNRPIGKSRDDFWWPTTDDFKPQRIEWMEEMIQKLEGCEDEEEITIK